MSYVLVDEANKSGKQLSFSQGDTKTVYVYLQDDNGAPIPVPYNATNIKVCIQGVSGTIMKDFSSGCGFLGAYYGFYFTLSSADTTNIPVLRLGANMSVKLITPTTQKDIDMPGCFLVTAPMVP